MSKWVAKNSVTGTIYGPQFDNIYDCQAFISSHLFLIEYEFRRAFAVERDIIDKLNDKSENLFDIIKHSFDDFGARSGIEECCHRLAESMFNKKNKSFKDVQKQIDLETEVISNIRWQKNNIIRCWYVEQERFADGFDF